ncbi:MAG: TldD/PmbA family protein [Candidatus Hodarchaeales archaeon]
MTENLQLSDVTKKLLDFSLQSGADGGEIFAVKEKRLGISHNGETIKTTSKIVVGIGIRISIGKKWGFTSSASLDLENAKNEVLEAIKIAKIRDEDPDFRGFPSPGKIPSFDQSNNGMKNPDIEGLVASLVDARSQALGLDSNLSNVQGSLSLVVGERAIANSSGLDYTYSKGSFSAGFSAVGSYGGHRFSENSFTGGSKFSVDFSGLALDAAQRTIDMFKESSNLESGNMDVLMEPTSAAIFFISISRLIFKGSLALSHRSMFSLDDLGKGVASKKLTLIDDGLLKNGLKTAPIDDEGIPSHTTHLIKDGILSNFLFDYSTANKAGVEPTGNAMRGIGHGAKTYSELPAIGARDRVIKAGSKTQEQLIAGIDHGILIGYPAGIFLGNPMTTDFTIFPTRVLEIRSGEIVGPVSNISMAGNGIQWLKKITEVGNDSKMMESVLAPSIVFSDILVTSGNKMKKKSGMMGMPPKMG